MKVKLPGINLDAEIISEQDALADDVIRVANTKAAHNARMEEGGWEVPGTKGGYFCKYCSAELVLAPSGQRIEAMGGQYICATCAMKTVEEN